MLRATTSTLTKSALRHSSRGVVPLGGAAPRCVEFHASSLKREEEKKDEVVEKPPTMLPGWWDPSYTIPVVFSLAIPAIHYDWVTINEETQLAGVIMGFCAICYSQAGDMIRNALVEKGDEVLKEQNEVEDAVIDSLQMMHSDLKMSQSIVQDMEDINKLTDETYAKLNAAGVIKPKYDFKSQVEKLLHAIEVEEASVTEKAKIALMQEATAAVEEQFATSKDLQKAALEGAIAKIRGTATAGDDPVRDAYVKFFQQKAAEAGSIDEVAEAKAKREALVAKLNATARNEGFYFDFDSSGKPKMVV
jgi:hypothetical protein